jgi:hypothetical protein
MFRVSIVLLTASMMLASPALAGNRSSGGGGFHSLEPSGHSRSETGAFHNRSSNFLNTHSSTGGRGRRSGGSRIIPLNGMSGAGDRSMGTLE